MENYYVTETEDTPSIFCDANNGVIEIEGNSLPENADDFYNPLIEWVDKYVENPKPKTIVDFKFTYLNSSSSKKIIEMLLALKKVLPINELKINWIYRDDDEDILEEGEDFSVMLKMDFNFKTI